MFKYQDNQLLQESLVTQLNEMQEKLKTLSTEELVVKSGARFQDDSDRLFIDVFFKEFEIDLNTFDVINEKKQLESILFQSIVLSYLTTSDGIPSSNKWIGFRELPNGENYCRAFQGYAPDRLSKYWGLCIDGFKKACLKAGGVSIDIGDTGFKFKVFPKIEIGVVYWVGDEFHNSRASILFDSNISHYMITAGLATIGNELVDQILKKSDD